MRGSVVSLEVRVRNRHIREFKDKKGRVFVEGRPGSKYDLVVKNHIGERVLVSLSVDGLSVMDGERASSKDKKGYIIPAYGKIKIPGWRLDNEEIARFKFAGREKAYAAKMGDPDNLGVIGCAVFKERTISLFTTWTAPAHYHYHTHTTHVPYTEYTISHMSDTSQTARDINACYSASDISEGSTCSTVETQHSGAEITPDWCEVRTSGNLGTEFGGREEHEVTEVVFEAQDAPCEVLALYYDDARGLRKRGINVKRSKPKGLGNPFPANGCEPPKGWKG